MCAAAHMICTSGPIFIWLRCTGNSQMPKSPDSHKLSLNIKCDINDMEKWCRSLYMYPTSLGVVRLSTECPQFKESMTTSKCLLASSFHQEPKGSDSKIENKEIQVTK